MRGGVNLFGRGWELQRINTGLKSVSVNVVIIRKFSPHKIKCYPNTFKDYQHFRGPVLNVLLNNIEELKK